MADKNFKVRHGLDVDGDATLTGDLAVQGNDVKSSTGNTAITLSDTSVEVKGTLQVTGNTISSSTATAMTLSGQDVAVAGDLTVSGNDVKGSSGQLALTFNAGDVTVAGDLTVTGNDIKSSTATSITMAGANVSVAGDLTVAGNTISSSSAPAIEMSGANVEIKGDLQVTGNDIKASSGNTNITMLDNILTIVQGDLRVDGDDIKSSADTVAITMSGSDVEVKGDLQVTGNDIKSSTGATAITLSGNSVTIPGDFTVNGTTTTLNTQTLNVEDNIITVNYGQTSPVLNAGIEVDRGVGNFVPAVRWNESTDRWETTVDGSTYIELPNQDLDTDANPAFAGATMGNITVGVATDGTITTTTGNLILDSSSDIITVNADTQLGTNKSIQMGTGVYSGSTDIWRQASGATGVFDGIEISNGGATATTSALVMRQFGQSTSGGGVNTQGEARILTVGSRGTQASPLAVNAGNNIFSISSYSNLGDNTGGGTGAGYSNEVVLAANAGMFFRASQNHRQTLGATFTANISSTTLTVTAMTSGTIVPGTLLKAAVNPVVNAVAILRQTASTEPSNALGGAGTYVISSPVYGTRTAETFTTLSINQGSLTAIAITPPNTSSTGNVTAFGSSWDANNYGLATIQTDRLTINAPHYSFPQYTRTVTAISGGDTLTVTGHGLTTTGATFVIVQAGNPNGLTTNLAYYVDAIVDANNIKLRTNSVSGGAVTGLTDGTGLFLQCQFYAQNRTGSNNVAPTIDLIGYRWGNNFQSAVPAANKTNDYLGQVYFSGTTGAAFPSGNVRVIGQATQDFAVGAYGSQLLIQTTKNSTTTAADTAKIGLNSTTFLSDSFLFENSSGTDNLTIDSSGNVVVTGDLRVNGNDLLASDGNTNITMTSNTLTTFAGDVRVNGGDLQASDGNTNITMTSNTLTTFAGDVRVNGNDLQASDGNTNITMTSNTLTRFAGDIRVDGNDIQASDGNTNITLSSNTLTTLAGDLRVNGNDIQASDGNTNITMNSNTLTTFAGDIRIDGGDIQNPGGSNAITLTTSNATTTIKGDTTYITKDNNDVLQKFNATESWYRSGRFVYGQVGTGSTIFDVTDNGSTGITSVYSNPYATSTTGVGNVTIAVSNTQSLIDLDAYSTDGSNVAGAMFQSTRRSGGNNAATQLGDRLGQLRFNGNTNTGTGQPSAPVTGGEIRLQASENWTGSATGTQIGLEVTKTGTTTNTTVFLSDAVTTEIRGDTINLRDSAGVALTSAGIGYTRTYGEFAYTNAAGFDIPAQNTIYTMPLDTTLNNSGVTISGTGEININVSGWYKIIMSLQVTLTVSNQPGQMDFWLRKNGVDVANSKTQVDLLKDQKAVIAMDWLVNSDGNDYWEIVYVGTTANYADIDFPTIAATTTPYVSPLAPALIVNVIPAGA